MRVPILAAALSLASAGCAVLHDPSLGPDTARDPKAPVDVQTLARRVAAVRRIELPHPIDAEPLPESAFVERLLSQKHERTGTTGDASTAFWRAFGFVPPGQAPGDAVRRALEEEVTGFYDPRTKKLYVRGGTLDGDRIALGKPGDFGTLAHEIEHALQDENFGLLYGRDIGQDEALAYHALVEGDATLTSVGVVALDRAPTEHWVSRATEILRNLTTDELVQKQGMRTRELQQSPALLRRLMVFPYLDGTAFVGDLVRAGGLRLLDDAFAHPPRSTEQVLHPQKYVAGEEPVPVMAPKEPEGWRHLTSGSMGELVMSMFLAECVPQAQADEAAADWGGDAWSIVAGADGHVALLLATTWDDETAAGRFEKALGARTSCLAQANLDPRVGRSVHVVRDGKRVAYVQGLPEELQEPTARALLALPGDAPPARPPFGAVTIPPLVNPEKAFAHKGWFDAGVWRDVPFGAVMRVPEGWVPVRPGPTDIAMKHERTGAFASMQLLFQSPSDALERYLVRRILAAYRGAAGLAGQMLTFAGDSVAPFAGEPMHEYKWHSTLGATVDVAFLPACEGRATVLFVMHWGSFASAAAIDQWLDALPLPAGDSPACKWLRQARDE